MFLFFGFAGFATAFVLSLSTTPRGEKEIPGIVKACVQPSSVPSCFCREYATDDASNRGQQPSSHNIPVHVIAPTRAYKDDKNSGIRGILLASVMLARRSRKTSYMPTRNHSGG